MLLYSKKCHVHVVYMYMYVPIALYVVRKSVLSFSLSLWLLKFICFFCWSSPVVVTHLKCYIVLIIIDFVAIHSTGWTDDYMHVHTCTCRLECLLSGLRGFCCCWVCFDWLEIDQSAVVRRIVKWSVSLIHKLAHLPGWLWRVKILTLIRLTLCTCI